MTVPRQIAGDYLSIMDTMEPGLVTGLYLVGSVALDDYHPGPSDIDFVAVTEEPADAEPVRRVHAEMVKLHRRPHFDGVYVTWPDLAQDPRKIAPGVHVLAGRTHTDSREARHPVTWHTLAQCGVPVRGPAPADLPLWTDGTALAESVHENLDTYWRRWHREGSRRASAKAAVALTDWGPTWVVLGVSRLHYTLTTGRITSKTGAGLYARETFGPEWHRIVDECLRLRRGEPGPSRYRSRFARRRDTLAFLDHAITDARAIA
jgi:hypothetical protein